MDENEACEPDFKKIHRVMLKWLREMELMLNWMTFKKEDFCGKVYIVPTAVVNELSEGKMKETGDQTPTFIPLWEQSFSLLVGYRHKNTAMNHFSSFSFVRVAASD